jgi:transcriptional regulator with GAF, ATPase, and Fis domain
MSAPRQQPASLAIWGLLAAFAILQAVAWAVGSVPRGVWGIAQLLVGWLIMLVLASVATRRLDRMAAELDQTVDAHRVTQHEVDQLQMHNAMLETLAQTVDVPLAFRSLAERIARLVPCDRVGLALLTETGDEFKTYTARVQDGDRRSKPRPDVVFKPEGTAIGAVVQSCQPMIIPDTAAVAAKYLDVNVAHTSGFVSVLLIPLVSDERAVGTLNVVARRRDAFSAEHVAALLPVTEILAMAYVAQQLQVSATRHRTMQSITELTLAVSTEINSALQTIIGHCNLIDRAHPDPALHRDIDTIVRQAQRISALLDKMRSASQQRTG